MPGRSVHRRMDRYLVRQGVITRDSYRFVSNRVHEIMDEGVYRWGKAHRERDEKHDPSYIRKIACRLSSRQRLRTDAIRIAHAHVLLDEVASMFPGIDPEVHINVAYTKLLSAGQHLTRSVG